MKFNFSQFTASILGILNLSAFKHDASGKETLTAEDEATLAQYGFDQRFIAGFKAHLSSPDPESNTTEGSRKQVAAMAATMGSLTSQLTARQEEVARLEKEALTRETELSALRSKAAEVDALKSKIKILSSLPETDPAQGAGMTSGGVAVFNLDDDKQLGGLQGECFSLDRAYNRRARAALYAAQGKEYIVASASPADFSSLKEDLGAYYRRPWQDRLQSFLVELPTILRLFPMESGHQDLDTLVNVFLGEFSQADSSDKSDFDKVTKGDFSFQTETLRMYGVMFVHIFPSLKTLEKSWIGYLNREGSNPVKLSFIEYLLAEVAKKLHNERELRFVNGVRKNPVPNEPGRAMEAADGIYEYIRKRVEGHIDFTPDGGTTGKTVYQIRPFVLGDITPGNIGRVVEKGTSMIPSHIRDTNNLVLYIPSHMVAWYRKYLELHYGTNQDYKSSYSKSDATPLAVHEYPGVKIEPILNADNHHRLIWTLSGNIHTYSQLEGEMLKFNIEQVDWRLKVWSNWKESIQAVAVGRKFTSKADVTGHDQLIWCNEYDFPADFYLEGKHGENPSVALHSSILIPEGTSLYEITDIMGAEPGQRLSIRNGGTKETGVKIKKSGKFALISADWTPGRNDSITLVKIAGDQFAEISRETGLSSGAYKIDADATELDLTGATDFIVGENSKPTEVGTLLNAEPGVVYTIYGNGKPGANASVIRKGDKFLLSEDIELSAGKYIQVVMDADGKFHEVARG